MRSKAWPFAAAWISCVAACDGGRTLGQDVIAVPPVVQKAEWDAAPAPGGGPVNPHPPSAVVDAAVVDSAFVAAEAEGVAEGGAAVEAGGAPDARAPRSDAVEAGSLLTCPALAAGGAPARLNNLQWQYQVGEIGTPSSPYDFVTLDSACLLTYQRTILPRPKPPAATTTTQHVTLTAADCAAARGWVTNTRFLDVLRTGDGCPYGPGNPGDVFDLDLTDEGRVARKTYLCPEPTVEAVRACLRPLVARLFP